MIGCRFVNKEILRNKYFFPQYTWTFMAVVAKCTLYTLSTANILKHIFYNSLFCIKILMVTSQNTLFLSNVR